MNVKKKKKVHTGWLVGLTAMLLFFYGFLLGGQQLVMMDIAAEYQVGTKGMGGLISAQHVAAVIMPLCMGLQQTELGRRGYWLSLPSFLGWVVSLPVYPEQSGCI